MKPAVPVSIPAVSIPAVSIPAVSIRAVSIPPVTRRSGPARRLSAAAFLAAAALTLRSTASAPEGHYTITSNTVLDTKTGLTWERVLSGTALTWANAGTYCSTLELDGSGWRMPTLKELLTLVDFSVDAPAVSIDSVAFPATPGEFFWSTPSGRGVGFNGGFAAAVTIPGTANVRCVR